MVERGAEYRYLDDGDNMPHQEYVAWQRETLGEMLRLAKPEGAIFYDCKWRVQAVRRCAEGKRGVTKLERRYRWLLHAYPAWFRRERSAQMLGTLLAASPPSQKWPSVRDARALGIGGLRIRGWTWSLSMVWIAAGAVLTGYYFYATTKPFESADILGCNFTGWCVGPAAAQVAAVLALFAWLGLALSVPIAGFIRFRGWRRGKWIRAATWAGAWIAGAALMLVAHAWADSPGVSWGELAVFAAWLVLAALMTGILAVPPARRSDV